MGTPEIKVPIRISVSNLQDKSPRSPDVNVHRPIVDKGITNGAEKRGVLDQNRAPEVPTDAGQIAGAAQEQTPRPGNK